MIYINRSCTLVNPAAENKRRRPRYVDCARGSVGQARADVFDHECDLEPKGPSIRSKMDLCLCTYHADMIGIIKDMTMEVRRSSVDRPTHFMSTSVRADHGYLSLAQDIILDPRPIYDGHGSAIQRRPTESERECVSIGMCFSEDDV